MNTAPKRIELPAFPDGKRIAVTTSWDDGRVYDRWVVAALNALGMQGTFNLNSGFLGRTGAPATTEDGYLDAAEVGALYVGHEVAVHSVTHPHLGMLDTGQMVAEVQADRAALEELVGYPVRGMAYPFGTYTSHVIHVLRTLGIVYSRTTEAGVTAFPPAEPLAWGTTQHIINAQPAPLPEQWAAFHGHPYSSGVFYVWGHSYEFAARRDDLTRLLAPLAGHDDVWYCTNIALFDYEAARQRLVIATNRRTAYNPSILPVTVNVDGTLVTAGPGVTAL